jgi:hypothetical protein
MEKTERLYKYKKIILDFFKTVSGTDSRKIRLQQLETLKQHVANLFKTYYERGISFYFDVQSWIESGLTGQEFAQVVRLVNLDARKV